LFIKLLILFGLFADTQALEEKLSKLQASQEQLAAQIKALQEAHDEQDVR